MHTYSRYVRYHQRHPLISSSTYIYCLARFSLVVAAPVVVAVVVVVVVVVASEPVAASELYPRLIFGLSVLFLPFSSKFLKH